jgi:hypothetical protein
MQFMLENVEQIGLAGLSFSSGLSTVTGFLKEKSITHHEEILSHVGVTMDGILDWMYLIY